MKRKLILINPVNPARKGLTYNRGSRFPPIGLGIIAALTPDHWDLEILDENWEPFKFKEADLVGITAFTASVSRAYEIAKIYRDKSIPVIMGGIHVSMCIDEAVQFADSVVVGEVESVWKEVISDVEQKVLKKIYRGKQLAPEKLANPRRDLFHSGYSFASVQTSRGCPMDCEFCSVTGFNGHKYRQRPTEDVLNELSDIKNKLIFFIDDNIIGYGPKAKANAIKLFQGMVKRKLNKIWFCQASINFADDDDVLYWARKAGCRMVFIGIEAEELDCLTEINKKQNLKIGTNNYQNVFLRINRAGIAVLGAFIFGLDSDTKEKLIKRNKFMIHSNVDVMQATVLTPFPGTRLFNKILNQNRLLYKKFPYDWHHFDMGEIVFRPQQMSVSDLSFTINNCSKSRYNWFILIYKAMKTLFKTKSISATLMAFSSNINYRNVSVN